MKLKIAILAAALALGTVLYAGAFTGRPGETGLKIGGIVTNRGC